ncbi:hypothetical protein BV898_06106 [Hypsibius exemplaris]|uniref:Uncharacterized protein n=1 Tax=Hypsibius exemplaris TaxID=2072580 RepID=A0A1W0WXB0_HYPEX|nr:hypothetical protein BV898_06106 [Hypsibius exemplaris]
MTTSIASIILGLLFLSNVLAQLQQQNDRPTKDIGSREIQRQYHLQADAHSTTQKWLWNMNDPCFPARAQDQNSTKNSCEDVFAHAILGLACLSGILADQHQMQNQGQLGQTQLQGLKPLTFPGFNGGGIQPLNTNVQTITNQASQKQGQAQGNSAAAGNAGSVGNGSASSINQANHQATQDKTASNALSANTATGSQGSSAGGAAQAGGAVQGAEQKNSNTASLASQFGIVPLPPIGGFGSLPLSGRPAGGVAVVPLPGAGGAGVAPAPVPVPVPASVPAPLPGAGGAGVAPPPVVVAVPVPGAGGVPVTSNSQTTEDKASQVQKESQGNAAAAGNAGTAGAGQSSSINQASHQADQDKTAAGALSANTAQGVQPAANGAAQVAGALQQQDQHAVAAGEKKDVKLGHRR